MVDARSDTLRLVGEVLLYIGAVAYVVSLFVPYSSVVVDFTSMTAVQVINPTWVIMAATASSLLATSLSILVSLIVKNQQVK